MLQRIFLRPELAAVPSNDDYVQVFKLEVSLLRNLDPG
jgi:hypothetical protein